MAGKFPYDESAFKPKQREAAIALVEYEFLPKGQRKTKQDIADELEITRKTLHNWNTQDQNFINYKNSISSDFLDTHMAFVYSRLIQSIDRGSVRGMELFMKRAGDLADKQEISFAEEQDTKTGEERANELKERLAKIQGEA